eukprot:g6723.t1
MSLNLEIPVRTRYASCNNSIESIQTRIEKHFELSGKANNNARREQETRSFALKTDTTVGTYNARRRKPSTLKKMSSVNKLEIKPSAREKMLVFSQKLKRKHSRKQNKSIKVVEDEVVEPAPEIFEDTEVLSMKEEKSPTPTEEERVSEEDDHCSSCNSVPVVTAVTQTWQGKEWNLWKTVTNVHTKPDTKYASKYYGA